ncbi:terminase large subunit [Dinoroseobacter phage vB_DshS-R5C]|uniref:Large packaging protein n=1 Tax=Dinoroseobacter phage vB_DshS-R5C TaxID=1965368 RepID=A0A1V0DY66_9CAUD|nr:terminase large subunit [Dinoroseobacter phage vB_DshS-R5C]ARB06077.1 large packaging protein [Dinoroseobacter phage vB_DshS-R5C]
MPFDQFQGVEFDPNLFKSHELGKALRSVGITMQSLREDPALAQYFFENLSPQVLKKLLADWHFLARDNQLPPTDDFYVWLFLAGRGAGKTRTGAEWVRDSIKAGMNRGGLIAPTAADTRDVMIEGESGLLSVCKPWDRDYRGNLMGIPVYEPSKRRVTWENGAFVTTYSAEEPARLRGPQHQFMWMDELAAWKSMEAFDQAIFGLRLRTPRGRKNQIFISTTPQRKPLVAELVAKALDPDNASFVRTRGSTDENASNMSAEAVAQMRERYDGTSLGRQELDGELLDEMEGALWTRTLIDSKRAMVRPDISDPDTFWFTRIVIGLDPATKSHEGADLTGIVVVGLGNDGHAYVLADYTGRYSPGEWAAKVQWAKEKWYADAIVAEVNQGGDMVKFTLEQSGVETGGNQLVMVHAAQGKVARAEPVAALYEQGKVHHVGRAVFDTHGLKNEGNLDLLEEQMVSWERNTATYSPDRIDALVWAIHDLILKSRKPIITGKLRGTH